MVRRINATVVSFDGLQVTIRFVDDDNDDDDVGLSSVSSYRASWLNSNDPRFVTLPSGQRRGGIDCDTAPMIVNASIVLLDVVQIDTEIESTAENVNMVRVPGPTMEDCCHPLAIYGSNPPWMSGTIIESSSIEDAPFSKNVRPYLVIQWAAGSIRGKAGDAEVNRSLSSTYDVDWLRRFRNDDASRAQKRWTSEVRPIHAVRSDGLLYGDNGLMRLDYSSIVGGEGDDETFSKAMEHQSTEGVFALLHAVFRDGAAIVYGAPAPSVISKDTNYPVAKIAMAVTSGNRLSHGALYGDVFHVREGERGAINAAYTSDGLRMHQDLAYYESPPGLQLLHCVENGSGVLGGESILIDGMAAAHRFRELRPVSFETLVRCSATFVKQRDGACMTYRRPHIVLADDNDDELEKYNIDRQIVAVHWSPPFEGPVDLPPRQVDRYHKAHADFDRMINGDNDDSNCKDRIIEKDLLQYAKEYTWERKLQPGEILVFNNRRMFHGRRAFSSLEGSSANDCRRHLVGCYTNIDDTLNLYRVLMRERGFESMTIMNPGNGTSLKP